MHANSFVLAPVFSQFEPHLSSGEIVAVGYRGAIAVDGAAILGLIPDTDNICTPHVSFVYVRTLHNALQKLLTP